MFFLIFPAYMAVAYSNAYDFKYGCEPLLACLPPGRKAVVAAKYALAATGGLAVPASALIRALLSAFGILSGMPAEIYIAVAGLTLILSALELAAYFRFGYMNSRWITFGLFAATGAVGGILGGSGKNPGAPPPLSIEMALALAAAGIFMFIVSYLYSRSVYGRREL